MAVVTNYVCDVSGKSGTNPDEFVKVTIISNKVDGGYFPPGVRLDKLVHMDVANKLNFVKQSIPEQEKNPEPTLESKLMILMKEYIQDIAYEAGGEAGHEAASNRN